MSEIFEIIISYGYIIIFIYSFAGGSLAILAGGVLAATGKLDIEYVLIVAGLANFLGDWFFFTYIKFLKKYFYSDLMSLVKNHRRKVAYTKLLIRKRGWMGVFIQKYIYIVRTLYPITLAISGYNYKKFMLLNFAASVFWALSLGYLSYSFSDVVLEFFNT